VLRVFAFGDLAGGPWGVAWIPSEPGQAGLLGFSAGSDGTPPRLEGAQATEPWQLSAGATELTVEGLGEPAASESSGESSGFDQLCQVTGALNGESGQTNIRCLGWRSAGSGPVAPGRLESFRQVAGWFEQTDGFALLAVRPEAGRGHERDQLSAAVFAPTGAKSVLDPRLSTTYDGSGAPTRASVELWFESEGENDTQYSRRAIGEALGEPGQARAGALALEAHPYRWYSGDREGAGIYLLGRAA
jgi:hypothetical protein